MHVIVQTVHLQTALVVNVRVPVLRRRVKLLVVQKRDVSRLPSSLSVSLIM